MFMSNLKMVSIGIVSEHKQSGSKLALVHPAEILCELDGALRSVPTELYAAGVDGEGTEYKVSIRADTSLQAEWLSFSQHRQTAPDIRRGEQVILWAVEGATDDKYYWSTMGRDTRLRRLESVLWAFSNVSDESAEVDALTHDNAYTVEVSTHNKNITIRTNTLDGEPFAYVIQLNTKDGNFTVTDDVGNYVQLDSKNTTIDMTNKDGTFYRLTKKDIFGYAPDSIYLEAVNTMQIKCKDLILNASNSVTTTTTTHSTSASTVSVSASTITKQAGSITFDSPVVTCTGLLSCAGLSTGVAGGSIGTATIGVPLTVTTITPELPSGYKNLPK